MAPKEPVHLPLRWEFVPVKAPHDGAVCWKWRAYTQSGKLEKEAAGQYDTLTECMEDAKSHGYGAR
jgi:hypothetical protein